MFYVSQKKLTPRLTKQDTKCRKSLRPGLKPVVNLRYLATSINYHSLAFSFTVAHNTISLFVSEVCESIIEDYEDPVFLLTI